MLGSGDGFTVRNRRDSAAADGSSIGNGTVSTQRRKLVEGCGIQDGCHTAGGDVDATDSQRRSGGDGRGCLRDTVEEQCSGAVLIGQGNQRLGAESVSTQIIGDSQAIVSKGACIANIDDIGHFAALCIVGLNCCFGDGENLLDLACSDVGIDHIVVVGQGCLVEKGCHGSAS